MRRVDCRTCGVRVEELPWAIGKHQHPERSMDEMVRPIRQSKMIMRAADRGGASFNHSPRNYGPT
jgi:hypothetical protein